MNTKNDVALLLTYFRKWKSEVNPSEIIKRCKRLVSLYGLSKAAKMVGVSGETMRIWAKLDGLPDEVKRLISKGDLLPTIAFDIVPRRRQIQIAKAVAGLPYKEAKEIIRHLRKTPQKSIKKIRNEVLDEFEEKELAGVIIGLPIQTYQTLQKKSKNVSKLIERIVEGWLKHGGPKLAVQKKERRSKEIVPVVVKLSRLTLTLLRKKSRQPANLVEQIVIGWAKQKK